MSWFVFPFPFSHEGDRRWWWISNQVTALLLYGDKDADLVKATVLADYAVHHLDGQDGYDLGGEG